MEGSNWMFYFWCSTSTLCLQRALTRNNELKFNLLKCAITSLVQNTLELKFQTRVPGQKTFAPFEMEIDLKLMVPFSDLKPILESTSAKKPGLLVISPITQRSVFGGRASGGKLILITCEQKSAPSESYSWPRVASAPGNGILRQRFGVKSLIAFSSAKFGRFVFEHFSVKFYYNLFQQNLLYQKTKKCPIFGIRVHLTK